MDEVLTELRSLGGVEVAQLQEVWFIRRAVERDLQILVEIVVDVCQRLISIAGQAPAATSADATGRCIQLGAQSDSDIDIAVLFESPPCLEAQIALLARLQDALQFEDVDLVVLNNANPILRFEAISGRPLFCRDLGRRAGFASLTAREYEDEMALWQRALGR